MARRCMPENLLFSLLFFDRIEFAFGEIGGNGIHSVDKGGNVYCDFERFGDLRFNRGNHEFQNLETV